MSGPRLLPSAPDDTPPRRLGARLKRFLVDRWAGRVLLLAAVLFAAGQAGAPLSCGLAVMAGVVLCGFAAWGLARVGRWLVRVLLWRIRTKLLVSYLFIAVVPL